MFQSYICWQMLFKVIIITILIVNHYNNNNNLVVKEGLTFTCTWEWSVKQTTSPEKQYECEKGAK